ncbi:hypothetical protein TBK1r_71640 [Stieleria magnilauensis]|uniref:Uncharacterized protein n=1 Tax=Stieleria magnilauensis TaxID=2527963 RepID=A0ABX5Y1I5_9BACT|nr:hypothetical protein TBK1r_71640 [Planctomycetes bacterium TBK1r]
MRGDREDRRVAIRHRSILSGSTASIKSSGGAARAGASPPVGVTVRLPSRLNFQVVDEATSPTHRYCRSGRGDESHAQVLPYWTRRRVLCSGRIGRGLVASSTTAYPKHKVTRSTRSRRRTRNTRRGLPPSGSSTHPAEMAGWRDTRCDRVTELSRYWGIAKFGGRANFSDEPWPPAVGVVAVAGTEADV